MSGVVPARVLVEDLQVNLPVRPGDELVVRPGWALWLGGGGTHPELAVVHRLRLAPDDVAAALRDVRTELAARGRPSATWEIGPSATPADVVARLGALGLTPYPDGPTVWGMLFEGAPIPAPLGGVAAGRAETVDDYVRAFEVLHAVFRERSESDAERRARAEATRARHAAGEGALFVARDGDRIVAAAGVRHAPGAVVLAGGATLPEARGRGAYRALVAVRHAHAIARGTPTLVIQAGAQSHPILARLGFTVVAPLTVLLDVLTSGPGGRDGA